MANVGLSICSCICSCFLAVINIFAVLFGAIYLLLGCTLAFGLGLLRNNEYVTKLLADLNEQLKGLAPEGMNTDKLISDLSYMTGSAGAALIAIGAIVVIIACLGCCGGCCKIRPCLVAYAAIVGVLFVAQLIVVIIWYADSDVLKSASKKAMESSVEKYSGIHSTNVETLLQNVLQIYVGCCGVNNGSDFHRLSRHWNRTATITLNGRTITYNLTYPVSCCQFDLVRLQPVDPICPYNNTASDKSNHAKGCYNEVFRYLDEYFLSYLFYTLSGVLLLQLLLVCGAVVIYCSVKTGKQKNNKVEPAI